MNDDINLDSLTTEFSEEEAKENQYTISARVKNQARLHDAQLTPMEEVLCNTYTLVLLDLYVFSNSLGKEKREELREILRNNENLPRRIIELGNQNRLKKK